MYIATFWYKTKVYKIRKGAREDMVILNELQKMVGTEGIYMDCKWYNFFLFFQFSLFAHTLSFVHSNCFLIFTFLPIFYIFPSEDCSLTVLLQMVEFSKYLLNQP